MGGQNGSSSNPSSFEPTIIGKNVSYKAAGSQNPAYSLTLRLSWWYVNLTYLVVNPVLHVVLEVQVALMDLLRPVLVQA
jgi:hypothetical protein